MENKEITEQEMKKYLLFFINTYGTKLQQDISIEEMAELQKAILKHRRNPTEETRKDIIDEIADVQIMLEQLKIIFYCDKEVKERIKYKLERQKERILIEKNVRKEINFDNYECDGQMQISDFPEVMP